MTMPNFSLGVVVPPVTVSLYVNRTSQLSWSMFLKSIDAAVLWRSVTLSCQQYIIGMYLMEVEKCDRS
jgi:hypothetical protein